MKFIHLRNATCILEIGQQRILVDPKKLAVLKGVIPLKDPKDGMYKKGQFVLIAGYIRDSAKSSKNIWLTREGLNIVLEQIENEVKNIDAEIVLLLRQIEK